MRHERWDRVMEGTVMWDLVLSWRCGGERVGTDGSGWMNVVTGTWVQQGGGMGTPAPV